MSGRKRYSSVEQDVGCADGAMTKVARLSKEDLYKYPIDDELANMQCTEHLYQSNSFRSKVGELLIYDHDQIHVCLA